VAKQDTPIGSVDRKVEGAGPVIEKIVREVWELAEVSLEEVESARLLMDALEGNGFAITSKGTAGVPTAFVAEWGSGSPALGFLPEYDALPGLGNEAVPRREPRKDGKTSGHGCGHNMLGAGLVGASIALKEVMAEQNIPGTLRVYGCAAEETEGAKVYMAREGLFSDLDAALHWHPMSYASVFNLRLAAMNHVAVEFFGKTAHAGMEPWNGRSALDAAELFTHAVNMMREHVEPTARIHYIYQSAGESPNIVPDHARVWLFVRDVDRPHVEKSTKWVEQIAEGAALATQTRAKVDIPYGTYDLLPNGPLAERMQVYLERVGVPEWTEEEQRFAEECQKNFEVETRGMATEVLPLSEEPTIGASTDVADVSWNTPTMGCTMPAWPQEVSPHTWPVVACGGTSIGLKGALHAAKVLAATGVEIMTDGKLREAARADLERRTRGRPYTSPLPPERKHPTGLS
jgi:aminobenzoyl-glutamate utilization protein B